MLDQRKKYLIEVLNSLSGKWDKAEGLIVLIEKTNDENLINKLIDTIKNGIKNVNDKQTKEKMENILSILEKMKEEERIEREKDIEMAEKILQETQW